MDYQLELFIESTENLITQVSKRKNNPLYVKADLEDMEAILLEILALLQGMVEHQHPAVLGLAQGRARNIIRQIKVIDSKDDQSPFTHLIMGLSMQADLLSLLLRQN
jgi:hypothetical protein